MEAAERGAGERVICPFMVRGADAMRKQINFFFSVLIYILTAFSVLALGFVIYFIVKEALPLFSEVSVSFRDALDADRLYGKHFVWNF